LKKIFEKYLNKQVGINIDKAFHIQSAQLVDIENDFFTVTLEENDDLHHFKYSSIVHVIENPKGVVIKKIFSHNKAYPIVIKIGHLFEYVPA